MFLVGLLLLTGCFKEDSEREKSDKMAKELATKMEQSDKNKTLENKILATKKGALNKTQIYLILKRYEIPLAVGYMFDPYYYQVPKDFIGDFWSKYNKFSSDNKISYSLFRNDCDDYASFARSYSKIVYNLKYADKGNPLFGEIHYIRKEDGQHHAINIAIVDDEVIFYEPQTSSRVFLTKKEIESITYWRF